MVGSLGTADKTPVSSSPIGAQMEATKKQLESVTVEPDSNRKRASELREKSEAKELEREELKAERAMLQARLCRVGAEETTSASSDIGKLRGTGLVPPGPGTTRLSHPVDLL